MATTSRHLAPVLTLFLSFLLALAVATPAGAATRHSSAPAVDARVGAAFVMQGRIVTAVRVRGEHAGQAITRRWTFSGQSCAGSVCQRLSLRRERSAHQFDGLVLTRVGIGRYAGSGRFYAGLVCRGQRWPRGEVVPYQITVQVAQAVPIQGIEFASALTATYTNSLRIDRTICPIGPSHDAAQYTGAAIALPSPPIAAFTSSVNGPTDTGTFADTSAPGAGGAAIVAHQWNFGDPGSGGADTAATANPMHTFIAPGSYGVSLTVTDANGLTSVVTQPVVAPGPPTAAFTESPVGQSLTYAFTDGSSPGIGGAPIVSWLWNFGDTASGGANQSIARDPQHTYTRPGTYQVCLIVTDANSRNGGTCTAVTVPQG